MILTRRAGTCAARSEVRSRKLGHKRHVDRGGSGTVRRSRDQQELSSVVRQDAESPKTPPGCVSEWDNGVRIWAKTWEEIIDECEARLHYYRDCLNFDAASEESLDHLRRLHGDHLPELLRDREGPAA